MAQAAFHFLHVAVGAYKSSEVSDGRLAIHSKAFGIEVVFGCIGAQSANDCLAIMGLR